MPLFTVPLALTLAKRFWKPALAVTVAVVAVVGFNHWKHNLIDHADKAGFARAEQQYTAAVDAANAREHATQVRLDQMGIAFGMLGEQRAQQIQLTVKPLTESIQHEVATDPRYRDCAVSDGVLHDLQTGRASVDAGIAASNPGTARP